jgi:hypothetical protein
VHATAAPAIPLGLSRLHRSVEIPGSTPAELVSVRHFRCAVSIASDRTRETGPGHGGASSLSSFSSGRVACRGRARASLNPGDSGDQGG